MPCIYIVVDLWYTYPQPHRQDFRQTFQHTIGPMEYFCDGNRVDPITYRLVRTPKRRTPVLTGDVVADCRRLIKKRCNERGCHIYGAGSQP